MQRFPIIPLIVALGLAATGCDDVLEACPACPSVSSGQWSVSGDPRLDHSLEAAVRLREAHEVESRKLAKAMQQALGAYGIESSADVLNPSTAQTLWQAAQLDLSREDVLVSLAAEPAACSVDGMRLSEAMLSCQDELGCFVSDDCRKERAAAPRSLCAGLCTGACDTACRGVCLSAPSSDGLTCDGTCLGACGQSQSSACTGLCLGDCSTACSSLSQDGRCQGHCFGQCSGICALDAPQTCVGICHGACGDGGNGPCEAPGSCRGQCSDDGCLGPCRGLVEPVPCDVRYCTSPSDVKGLAQCRASLRDLSVAQLECNGAKAVLAVRFVGLPPVDAAAVLDRLRILENALTVALEVRSWASLIALGEDTAKELDPAWLGSMSETVASEREEVDLAAAFVPPGLAEAPVWALKARLYALSQEGVSTRFDVAAGAATCVSSAFTEAHQLVDSLAPVSTSDGGELQALSNPGSILGLLDTATALASALLLP